MSRPDLADHAVAEAMNSEYFSGATLADDLTKFLATKAESCHALADEFGAGIQRLYLVGSGGSYADVVGIKYTLDGVLSMPIEAVASYELIWRSPRALDHNSIAAFVSLSGETEDTLAALRYAKSRSARTIAIVRSEDSTLASEADAFIAFDSTACYEAPVTALTLFGLRLAELRGASTEIDELRSGIFEVPGVVRTAMEHERPLAAAKAARFNESVHMMVVGAGPLSSLAYKVALTVLMENVRIVGTYCDASEFRHGPAEAFDRTNPDMMFLLGTDQSREMALRTLDFCTKNGARTLVYDAAESAASVPPLLTGLVLNSLTQWFVVHSAIHRGILDLDDRVYMGRNVLATGGATWP